MDTLSSQLTEYFTGTRMAFDVPLVVPDIDFQRRVWEDLRAIPYGTTRSYQEQAEASGRPTAMRREAGPR